jgi:pimeloyl-ACP methyl ester carboxylesterase
VKTNGQKLSVMKYCHLQLTIIILITACSNTPVSRINYNNIEKGRCDADTSNRYHYVLPESHDGKLALLIILDSGGDGLLAAKKGLEGVTKIPCVIIGSDVVRNNNPFYIRIILGLIQDAEKKFPVDKDRIFLAGFSGGARMALEYARQYPVKGVLMCGAGPGTGSFNDLPCKVYMISGTTDFNFSEMYYNPVRVSGGEKFMSDYFRGKHEWPPAANLENGLIWLMAGENKNLAKEHFGYLVNKADSLLAQNETLFGLKALENAMALDGKNKAAFKKHSEVAASRKIEDHLDLLERNLFVERRIGQAYVETMVDKDSLFWFNEISDLSNQIAASKGEENDHYQRIKAFLGIMFFSRINALLRSDPLNKQTVTLLAAYRKLEPENPDVYYDLALYEKNLNRQQKSQLYLKKAISLGFKDQIKLKSDFPD